MSELSVKKLNEYKRSLGFSNRKIAELTGISQVSIDNIFSGKNKNPTVASIMKISRLFNCAMDDLIDYDKNSPLANYYETKVANEIAQEIFNNPDLKNLFYLSKSLKKEDLNLINSIAKRLSK